MTSRELVKRTLEFTNTSGRAPRDLWLLDWATDRYQNEIDAIRARYPSDYMSPNVVYAERSAVERGSTITLEFTDTAARD